MTDAIPAATPSDLQTAGGLRVAVDTVKDLVQEEPHHRKRLQAVEDFLAWLKATPAEEHESLAFQMRLWNDNPLVPRTRAVKLPTALEDAGFRAEFTAAVQEAVDSPKAERRVLIARLEREFQGRLAAHSEDPASLRIFPVLGVLFPRDITAIAYPEDLRRLHRDLFPASGYDEVVDLEFR